MAAATPTDGSVAANDIGSVAMSTDRRLHVDADTTLQANDGVDIGDVDVTSIIPGTAATNLGKAIDSVVGATDTGIAMLARHRGDTIHTIVAEGDYEILDISEFGGLHVEPEQHHVIDQMDALMANGGTWAAIDSDTTGVALSTKHTIGAGSIEFDKVDGAANSGIGGITKSLTAIDLGGLSPHDILQTIVYVGATTELDGGSAYFFLRLGTDSTDYNEWRIDGTAFTAGEWETVAIEIGDASFAGQGGTGCNFSVITYVAVGFKFDAVGDTLANIYVDEISFHTNQHVNAAISAEITSSVSSANINVLKIGGSVVTKGAGNVSNGSQRVVLATDDVNTAAIKTATETIAAAVSTQMQVDVVAALPAGTNAIGKLAANSGVDIGDVDILSIAAGANLIGDVGLSGARTSGGTTIFRSIDLDEGTLEVVKASAGQIYWIHVMNLATATRFVKIYNATSGTYGTGTPVLTFPIATQGDSNGAGFTLSIPNGIAFATGISIGAGTGVADNDTGAPGANEVIVNIGFA